MIPVLLACTAAWESVWWLARRNRRGVMYKSARQAANAMGRPLLVVGAPDGGVTAGYPCGDITMDLNGSSCPRHIQADITKLIPLPGDSVVVFVSCVLEYVADVDAAMRELERVSGGHMYVVSVEPWTLAAYLYPGAKRTVPERAGLVLRG